MQSASKFFSNFATKYSYLGLWKLQSKINGFDKAFARKISNERQPAEADLPSSSQIVICGGGVIGCSVAYHLAKIGFTNIVLLEQGNLACGTTWHAASLLGGMKNSSVETQLACYGVELYRDLEKETGLGTSWKNCGSLSLARSQDRLTFLKRQHGKARAFGVTSEFISPLEAGKKWPNMRTDDVTGALWFPNDAAGIGSDITQSLAKGAKMLGVEVLEGVMVESIQTKNNAISTVTTNKGTIDCEVFVNCAGQWGRELGLKSDPVVNVPLHATEHFYIVTKPLPDIDPMLPVLRDADGGTYFREWNGGILAGGFEPKAKPIFYDKIPEKFEFQLFAEDWDHFGGAIYVHSTGSGKKITRSKGNLLYEKVLLKEIVHRYPPIEKAEIRQMVNGPESFTPDGKILIGEVPEIDNYYIACAMNSHGIVAAAGVGRALAEWIKNKGSTMDLSSVDIKRFSRYHNNKTYLRDTVARIVGYQYALPYPTSLPPAVRNMKSSPLYDTLQAQGASWSSVMGWECPAWFSRDGIDPQSNMATFGKPGWFNNVKNEVEACTSGVGVADISATLKIEISGSSSVNLLQFLCSNNVDVQPGRALRTLLLNPKGGIEGFSTLYRMEKDRFYLIDSITQATRLLSWISKHSRNYDDITVTDVTSHYSGLSLIGPASTELLQSLTQTSLDSEDFRLNSVKRIDVGYASDILVARGSDEWKLFLFPEFLRNLYNEVIESGRKHNITNVGLYALKSISIEDGIPGVGSELTQSCLPQNVGLNSLVDLSKKTEYISDRDILSHAPSNNRLVHVSMRCHDDDNFPWGGEPLLHDDAIVGMTTSAACGFKGSEPVAMATIELPKGLDDVAGVEFEIEIASKRYPVDVCFLRSE